MSSALRIDVRSTTKVLCLKRPAGGRSAEGASPTRPSLVRRDALCLFGPYIRDQGQVDELGGQLRKSAGFAGEQALGGDR